MKMSSKMKSNPLSMSDEDFTKQMGPDQPDTDDEDDNEPDEDDQDFADAKSALQSAIGMVSSSQTELMGYLKKAMTSLDAGIKADKVEMDEDDKA
jgi:hypothetical protein